LEPAAGVEPATF